MTKQIVDLCSNAAAAAAAAAAEADGEAGKEAEAGRAQTQEVHCLPTRPSSVLAVTVCLTWQLELSKVFKPYSLYSTLWLYLPQNPM